MLDVWQAADDIEHFESGWNFDHFYPIHSDNSHGPCLEGWSTLTALAQATKRIRVGVLVTGLPYRHPAVMAKKPQCGLVARWKVSGLAPWRPLTKRSSGKAASKGASSPGRSIPSI